MLIGSGPTMQKLKQRIARFAVVPFPVLIAGESGTGKELVARSLYKQGHHRGRFVAVNCAAIPADLMEAELFGHERGAYTGADKARDGLFRQAEGGVLFLDEVGEMSTVMQAKLLRALQEKEVRPVGGSRSYAINARIIAASNRDMQSSIHLRPDLYYRLSSLTVHTPPLRDHPEDIPELASFFMETTAKELQGSDLGILPKSFTNAALECLYSYPWPGNVRELQGTIQAAMVEAEDWVVDVGDLSISRCCQTTVLPKSPAADNTLPLDEQLKVYERQLIADALRHAAGNVTEAASRLHCPYSSLTAKVRKYGGTDALLAA